MSLEVKILQIEKEEAGKIVYIAVSGKLEKEDYEMFVPEMERAIEQHGKISLLFELLDFRGWSAGAAWEDTKFGVKHFNDIKRLAIVGENKWERGIAIFAKPFTMAKVRYFDIGERDAAERWINEVKQETQEAIQALKGYSLDQRDEAVKKTKAVLDKLDSRIDALETRVDNNWDNMDAAARKKYRTALKSLRKQRTQLSEWYGSLKHSSADAWEDIKKGFSDAYISFSDAWEKAETEFDSSESGKKSK